MHRSTLINSHPPLGEQDCRPGTASPIAHEFRGGWAGLRRLDYSGFTADLVLTLINNNNRMSTMVVLIL